MDQKKRNITGAYPGANGAPQPKKNRNPAGSYPGKKAASKRGAPQKERPQTERPAAEQQKPRAKRFKAAMLFSKEILLQYRKTLIYYSCILVASVLLASWLCGVGNEVLALIRPDKEVTVTIEEGSSLRRIAKAMKEAGLIEHPKVFELYCTLKKYKTFESGEFTINCNDDYNHMIYALRASSEDKKTLSFTFKAGQTQEDLVKLLCDEMDCFEREELEKVLQTYDFSEYSFLKKLPERNYRLEGYLYPGEYELIEGESALAVVERMLDRFEEQVLNEENQKLIKKSKYSLDELITLASVLQMEGGDDLPKGAAVYFNRLKSDFPYLQSQATIAYILPAEHGKITAADLKAEDPYNTYRNQGLPQGPIANPGKEAIAAVLSPAETEAEFFVTSEKGKMLFAESLSEHKSNLRKVDAPRGTETIS